MYSALGEHCRDYIAIELRTVVWLKGNIMHDGTATLPRNVKKDTRARFSAKGSDALSNVQGAHNTWRRHVERHVWRRQIKWVNLNIGD